MISDRHYASNTVLTAWLSTCLLHPAWRPLIEAICPDQEGGLFKVGAGLCDLTFHNDAIEKIGVEIGYSGHRERIPELCGSQYSLTRVEFREFVQRDFPKRSRQPSLFELDHISINSARFDQDIIAWTEFLREQPVLESERSWSVADEALVTAAHFFSPNIPYITIRDWSNAIGGGSDLDHIGFRCVTGDAIDEAFGLVQSLGWECLSAPQNLDGSVLFHFRGPDRRVHDFFYPIAYL